MGNPPPHRARKRFGQHFLHDRNIINKILRAIDPKQNDNLLEIGPGQGALTLPLLNYCAQLTAIELDRDLIPILQQAAVQSGGLNVINADILKFELGNLPHPERLRIVGNLPYNISTPLMFHLMDSISQVRDMHFMVQKEVAKRIVAGVGTRDYGRLSVMLQYYCECQYLFDVAPGCFTPPPKVDSAIIRLTPHRNPVVRLKDFNTFREIIQTAFNQRRKTIANSLKAIVSPQTIDACKLDRRLRAENLTLQEFANLANAVSSGDIRE
jgi:16S rRNA (adenine1518-N6/adenine1519-N6)-dimethyltransferase